MAHNAGLRILIVPDDIMVTLGGDCKPFPIKYLEDFNAVPFRPIP